MAKPSRPLHVVKPAEETLPKATPEPPKPPVACGVYTVAQVARKFGISEWTVRKLVADGAPPLGSLALPLRSRIVFPAAAVDALLEHGPQVS
jgi:hypothetical protein